MILLGVSLGLSLASGAALKGECFGAHTENWRSRICYNDIQPPYHDRGIDHHVFPYIHATLSGRVGSHGFNEYPVLTGLFMWATGWVSWSGSSYLVVTMILLSACATLASLLLWRLVGERVAFWAASPILALYAFHNWDLLAVAASVVGIYLWWSGHSSRVALAFAQLDGLDPVRRQVSASELCQRSILSHGAMLAAIGRGAGCQRRGLWLQAVGLARPACSSASILRPEPSTPNGESRAKLN